MQNLESTQIVVLAGGLGTRLRPITEKIPKALVEVNGRPFIYWQLKWFKKFGLKKILFLVGYKGEMIEEFCQNISKEFNFEFQFLYDGEKLLGTGGSIRKALEKNLLEEYFILQYGDSFLPINYLQFVNFYDRSKMDILMSVYKNNSQFDKSNTIFDSKKNKVLLYDKKNTTSELQNKFQYIDYGLSILSKKVITEINQDTFYDLSDLYNKLSVEEKIFGFEVFNRFYEVGSPSGVEEFDKWLKENSSF